MDVNKAKKRVDRLQEYQAQKEMKSMQDQGNSIGVMIDKLKTTDNLMPDNTEALLKPHGGKYRIDQQHFALMFLETFQKEDPITGDMKPKYKNVSDMLNVPEPTLKFWWKKRDELMAQQSTMMIEGMNYLSTAFMVELIRMTEAMRSVDYNEMVAGSPADMKNFILLFNTVLNKFRLLSNQSTSNVSHEHKVQMVIPEDD